MRLGSSMQAITRSRPPHDGHYNRTRLAGFADVVGTIDGWAMRSWTDAPSMLATLDDHLGAASLISLDHDLYRQTDDAPDPGSGRDVADALATRDPACPVIVHSTNSDAAWGMFNALSAAGWTAELVHHLDQDGWIRSLWLPAALRLTARPAPAGEPGPAPSAG